MAWEQRAQFCGDARRHLVDDIAPALTDQAIDKIRRQLTGILARMERPDRRRRSARAALFRDAIAPQSWRA